MAQTEVAPSYQAGTSTLTRKGQVTIPVLVRRLLGVGPHDRVAFVVIQGEVRLAPVSSVVARTAGMLWSDQPAPPSDEEEAAVELAIAEEADAS